MSTTKHTVDTDSLTVNNTTILKWNVQNFSNVLKNNVSLICPHEKSGQQGFSLQIVFPVDRQQYLDIYFMVPKSSYFSSSLTITGDKDDRVSNKTAIYNRSTYEIVYFDKKYPAVQPHMWQYFVTLHKEIITEHIKSHLSSKLMFQIAFAMNYPDIPEAKLTNDFENLLNNGLYSDVTMKSADGIEYKVHKAVLASRSAVLQAHFEHNSIECDTNVIESPIEADILQEVLTFIYSDKTPRVDEIPEKILVAADYYQLNRLKSLCEKCLHKKLSVENAIEILQLADLHSANTLKQFTLKFIKNSPKGLITETDGWSQLKSVELIKSICECFMAK